MPYAGQRGQAWTQADGHLAAPVQPAPATASPPPTMPRRARADALRGRQMAGLIRPPSRTSNRSHLLFPGEINEHARQLGTQPAVRLPPVETSSSPSKNVFPQPNESSKSSLTSGAKSDRAPAPCRLASILLLAELHAGEEAGWPAGLPVDKESCCVGR